MYIEEDWGLTPGQLQDFEDEAAAQARRRAKIKALERQIQVLQGRLEAREATIRGQQAKIARLQGLLRSHVTVGQDAEA